MHKHRLHGVIVGGIFAALITWVAGSDTWPKVALLYWLPWYLAYPRVFALGL
jgi:hypothetical protein